MIIRRRRNGSFTIVGNHAVDDGRLSYEALGLLTYLLGRPDNWNIHVNQLCDRGGCGRDRLRRLMRELIEVGYVIRRKIRDGGGKLIGDQYVVYDEPDKSQENEVVSPETEKPALVEPSLAEPALENTSPVIRRNNNKHSQGTNEERDAGAGASEDEGGVPATAGASGRAAKGPAGRMLDSDGRDVDDFRRAYVGASGEMRDPIVDAWSELTPKQRKAAIDSIPAFMDERKMTKAGGKLLMAVTYLRDRSWMVIGEAAKRKHMATLPPTEDGRHLAKVWGREFYAALLMAVQGGRADRIRFLTRMANEGQVKDILVGPQDLPSEERLAAMKGYPADGPVVARWKEWFGRHGVALDIRVGMWPQLPSDHPPPGCTVWTDDVQRKAG